MTKFSCTIDVTQPDDEGPAGAYRSGVAARLAGLSVETLRVWERRYGVSVPQRSPHGQRLYSSEQVRRLGLIKQLVDQGHAIGALAGLPVERLLQLVHPLVSEVRTPTRPLRVALVGEGLAWRMAAGGRANLALDVLRTCASLDGAGHALREVCADVLLIEVPELTEAALPLIADAHQAAGAAAVVVLYRFCASATIRQLRAQGYLVAREPADLAEIVLLCDMALAARPSDAAGAPWRGVPATPRRLDDQALATLAAAAANNAVCECARHLAEILLMLGSFERYSDQCGARCPDDALLHQALNQAAGQARALLESAMERLARAEGLPLPLALQR